MRDKELDGLESMLRRLSAGYQAARRGNRRARPDELLARVEQRIQSLAETPGLALARRFRLTTLAQRYQSYRELWRRQCEQAGGDNSSGAMSVPPATGPVVAGADNGNANTNEIPPGSASCPPPVVEKAGRPAASESGRVNHKSPRQSSPREESRPETADGVIRITVANPQADEEKIRRLYDTFTQLTSSPKKRAVNNGSTLGTSLPWPQFFKYIATRVRRLREESGCAAVALTLALTDSAVRFTAEATDGEDL